MSPEQLAAGGIEAASRLFAALQRPWMWGDAGPVVSRAVRERLQRMRGPGGGPLSADLPAIVERRTSRDGATALVLSFGRDVVEAVHMPRSVGRGRVTLCVSSQVGCAMGCGFCATARMGFGRHLGAGEIVAQVLAAVGELGPRHPGELTLVFMGMGEPLHNLENVAPAVEVLCHPAGLGLSPRRITVSTAGLVPELRRLAALVVRPLLAISLNATTDELRRELMPVNRRYPLSELRAALTRYPWRTRERVTVEYVLLAGVNDSEEDARRLADFCMPFPHQINLIPFNSHPDALFRAPSDEHVSGFARAILSRRPAIVTVRRSRGTDVRAACGQLARETPVLS